MICFLTSSPCPRGEAFFDDRNGFTDELHSAVPDPCKCLFICSDPDNYAFTESFAQMMKNTFNNAGIAFSDYNILDGRNKSKAEQLVHEANLLILAGGHVPTQNRFFCEIGLREIMKSYSGVVLGISAGTMNSADTVYAQPELEGEAVSPNYQRFLTGLGLTTTMVLPHYQAIKDDVLDGLRVFEDITYPDSIGRKFYALVDGSYIYVNNDIQELRGEAYLIEDGGISKISDTGDRIELS